MMTSTNNRGCLDEDTLIVVASFMLAVKSLALEITALPGDMRGRSTEYISRLALCGSEKTLRDKPRDELLLDLAELAGCLGIDFIPNENGDH